MTQAIPFKGSGLSPVWFPTGVALFFLVWWSPKLWPAVFIAATMMNDYPFDPRDLYLSLVNSLEPALAAYLFLHIFKNRERLADAIGLTSLLALGGLVAPLLGSFLALVGERWIHLPTEVPETTHWLLWTGGDLNGVLLATPLLLGFVLEDWETGWEFKRIMEGVITLGLLIFVTGLVFDSWERMLPVLDLGDEVIGQSFLVLPLLGWIAIRFSGTFTGLSVLVSMGIAMWQTVNGRGPYASGRVHGDILWLHLFMAVAAAFATLIAAGKRDRDRHQGTLQESSEHYRSLFERNPQPMWVYDPLTLRFLDVNEAAVKKYGYSREEFLRMTLRDIRPAKDIPALLDDAAHADDTVKEWQHIRKDGSMLDVEISATGLAFGGRSVRLVLANDITARKALEAELRDAQRLEALGRSDLF
jgi:PAS domain S-box-containing protein